MFQRSRYTGLKEAVSDEDALREIAGRELGCEPGTLRVSERSDPGDLPGWSADVAGCGKEAIYKVTGRAGWQKQ